MVFFTCNHCGESVKKPAVEKHYNMRCRGAYKNVSCMDCQRDFHGEDYVGHTKCITEAQKYSGKDYVHKEPKNSGAKKQESWMEIVRSILTTKEYKLSPQARNVFQRLQSHDNVPRKKAKFQNFVGNCMRIPKDQAEEVWGVLEQEMEKMKQARQQENPQQAKAEVTTNGASGEEKEAAKENGHKADEPLKKAKKKKTNAESEQQENDEVVGKRRKLDTSEGEEHSLSKNEPVEEAEGFDWSSALVKIVAKHAEGIPQEKLKKKILKKYLNKLGLTELTEKKAKKFERKFNKNLEKSPGLKVDAAGLVSAC